MNFSYGRKPNPLFNPMHHSFANYSTDTMAKTELHRDFGDEIFLNNLHLIPDPLKKNLADTLITAEKPQIIKQKSEETTKMPAEDEKEMTGSTFSGIYSFISGVFNSLSGAMFRPKSPVYYDCFGSDSDWQQSNTEQDKIGPVSNPVATGDASDMSSKCRTAAKTCEGKLNEIRYVLSSPKPTTSVWYRKRPKKVFIEAGSVEEHFEDAFSPEDFIPMPNQTFIECYSPYTYQKEDLYQTGALKTKVEPPWTANIVNVTDKDVQENSVLNDEHSSEHGKDTLNLDSLQSEKDNLNMENENLKMETVKLEMEKENLNSEKTDLNLDKETLDKIETNTKQNLDTKKEDLNITMINTNSNLESQPALEKPISNLENQNSNLEQSIPSSLENTIDEVDCVVTDKQKLIMSCEDKLSKLKALLCKNKRTRYTYNPEDSATKTMVLNSADKHYKNPHRTTDKRRKSKLKKNINDDMLFANEIDSEVIDESPLNSFTQTCLGDYFDEVTGRFRTTSTTDSDDSFQIVFNDTPRMRIPSECDSEDSFIIFEESPDSCYTSNDVFGASDTESDSEVSDSGCSTLTCKLSHSLSRTVSNLTDDSLYVESGDEIDSTNVETVLKCDEVNKSLLIDDEKKKSRKEQPVKKVHFSNDPPKVHLMRVWAFAARQARAGHWERYAVDRERFKRRIADVDMAVSWVLKPQHRSRVMFQRFMPWWNAQRRKELAEKKQREEEERNIQAELVKQQELLQQAELENREIAEKQMEEERVKQVELVKQQELLQQDELESKGLVENQMEEEMSKQQQLVKQEELLQQEDFETKELIETKQGELANQELLPQQEELIHQELREQQELLQHKDHDRLDNIKCIEEAKLSNENVPIFVQNNENNQEITKNSIPSDLNYDRTLDSSNEKSYSSDDCADFDKILPKERKKQSNFELV